VTQREHGTIACYRWGVAYGKQDWRKGCRCQDCRTAVKIYNVKLNRRRERGEEILHDATEVREHILWLRTQNVGMRAIEAATGLRRGTIGKIASGQTKRCRAETIAKILAVGTHRRAPGALVDARPTWRLINDMLRNGFTKTQIAAELGSTAERPALQLKRDLILQSTADEVQEMYDRLMAPVIARREWGARRQQAYRASLAEAAG